MKLRSMPPGNAGAQEQMAGLNLAELRTCGGVACREQVAAEVEGGAGPVAVLDRHAEHWKHPAKLRLRHRDSNVRDDTELFSIWDS